MEARLAIAPKWEQIASVTNEAQLFFVAHGIAPDAADALAMVATELSENAVKYGAPGSEQVQVRFAVAPGECLVEVTSSVDPSAPQGLQHLDTLVQWIRGFQDPFQAYVERLRQVAAQNSVERSSGLGLVRVAYEGRSLLDFVVDTNNRLTVSAVRKD